MDNKEINSNGYDYVDLRLPSGTLWATCNVGANKPSDYGLYFQWGDTMGYMAEQVGTGSEQKKFEFDYSDYKWYLSGNAYNDSLKFKKYKTTDATLDLEDDAAHVNMGGEWHMPTTEQFDELFNSTHFKFTTLDGIEGVSFTSKKDGTKSIFIPAAGYAWDGSVQFSGVYGYVWSSVLYTDDADDGQGLYFGSGGVYLFGNYRYYGLSVRGVIG